MIQKKLTSHDAAHTDDYPKQIRLLDGAGLEAAEIARIIGRPRTTVTSEVAKVRAKKRDNKNSGRKE